MKDDEGRMNALRATAHPLRLQMLSLLTGTAMSAAEVARELDLTHANASYHLRVLVDAGELVEAGEEKIRGGVAKRYRYPHEQGGLDPKPGKVSLEDRMAYVRALGRELERRVLHHRPRTKAQGSDLEGWVDPEAWQRALALLAEASAVLHAANRPPRTPGTRHVSFTTWAFEMRTDPRPDPRRDPRPGGHSAREEPS